MKITIDTDVIARYKLTLGEFLLALTGYFDIPKDACWSIYKYYKYFSKDITGKNFLVLSDKGKDTIAKILIESSPKLEKSPVKDFEALAKKLMDIYPEGNKEGTTYPWRGTVEEIAQKLRVLVVEHDFIFFEEEAINAVKTYIKLFTDINDFSKMKLLKYFILRTKTHNGEKEVVSDFMTIIENERGNEYAEALKNSMWYNMSKKK